MKRSAHILLTCSVVCAQMFRLTAADPQMHIGAATISITPDQPIALDGQFHARISKGVDNPISATAVAIEARDGARVVDQAVLVSCDLASIRPHVLAAVRERLARSLPDLDARKVILTATHSHTSAVTEEGIYELPKEGVMQPAQYTAFFANRIDELVRRAWTQRKPGSVGWGLGQAVVGYNRRAVYADGKAMMYGKCDRPDFRGIEGFQDHSLGLLFFWNEAAQPPVAIAANLACPSQELESGMKVNADFWHDVRQQFQTGEAQNTFVLGWPAAAGDQSPHRMFRKAAEERMLKLRGTTYVQEIGRRISGEMREICPLVAKEEHASAPFAHRVEDLALPVRKVTPKEAAEAQAEIDALIKKGDLSRRRLWYQKVVDRFHKQDLEPTVSIEVHVLRIGDVAIATNPFELFLDYGVQIQGRSKALQTFVLQLTCGSRGYLATERAVKGGHYSAVVASNQVGPEGGQLLVDRTVEWINSLW